MDINEKVIEIVAYQDDKKSVSLNSKLDSFGYDSLDYIELVMMLEDEFDLEFEDTVELKLQSLETVGDLCGFVKFSIDSKQRYINGNMIDLYFTERNKKMVTPDKAPAKARPANHQKRWTEDDEGLLVFRYAQGTPIDLIAKELSRTKVAILGRLAELGFVYFDKEENAYFTVPTLIYQF